LQQGYLGQLLLMKQVWLAFTRLLEKYAAPEFRPAWRLEAAYAGGMLYDYGPHVIDQALDLAGAPVTEVYAELRGLVWGKEVDDYFNIILRFANGVTAQLEATTACRGGFSTQLLVGTQASYRDGFLFRGDTEPPQQVQVTPAQTPIDAYYVNVHEHLVNNAPLIITPEYARTLVAIMDACRKSNETRQVTKLG
jgi:predicted dehydrogenase